MSIKTIQFQAYILGKPPENRRLASSRKKYSAFEKNCSNTSASALVNMKKEILRLEKTFSNGAASVEPQATSDSTRDFKVGTKLQKDIKNHS